MENIYFKIMIKLKKVDKKMSKKIFDTKFSELFLLNNFSKKYLYKKEIIQEPKNIMSLDIMNNILSINSNWNNKNFQMMLNKKAINYSDYSSLSLETAGQFLRPDVSKVEKWISTGASIILNDINRFNSGLLNISNELQELTNGKCQANLYFSMESNQAFGPHCDEHDVFAFHFEGEKVWNIYENIDNAPINHPMFKYSAEERTKRAGKLIDQITLKPGDLLYLPRGQYHDALASKSGAIHVAFGLTYFKSIDLLSLLWGKFLVSDFIRKDIKQNASKVHLKDHLKTLSKELEMIINTKEITDLVYDNIKQWPYPIKEYSLRNIILEGRKYKVSKLIKIIKNGDQSFLTNGKDKVAIPINYVEITNFILKYETITTNFIISSFKKIPEKEIYECIEQLNSMKVII